MAQLLLLVEVEQRSYQCLNAEIYTPTLFQVSQFSMLKYEDILRDLIRPPSQRKTASTCHCRSLTYVSIMYVQLKHRFVSSLHCGNGCNHDSSIASCVLKQELPAHARKGYKRVHQSREPSFIIFSLSLAAKLLIWKDIEVLLLWCITIMSHAPARHVM